MDERGIVEARAKQMEAKRKILAAWARVWMGGEMSEEAMLKLYEDYRVITEGRA